MSLLDLVDFSDIGCSYGDKSICLGIDRGAHLIDRFKPTPCNYFPILTKSILKRFSRVGVQLNGIMIKERVDSELYVQAYHQCSIIL